MHVAAPIMDGNQIIGVVTVAKPNRTVQPFIDRTQKRLLIFGGTIIIAGILAGMMLAIWLSASIRRLRKYAIDVSEGRRTEVPKSASGELRQLADALESMRTQLEGKAYVERYVQTLTHELKSPLAAIHGAAELLKQEMPEDQRQKFVSNIDVETTRVQQLVERLLNLAVVEQRRHLEDVTTTPVGELIDTALGSFNPRISSKHLNVELHIEDQATVTGERFLLQQALMNLIDNAVDFAASNGSIRITAIKNDHSITIGIWNQGAAIPEFALPRLTERFYSLPRPDSGRKSTGLGLNFVKEVAELHHGSLIIRNVNGGVEAELVIGL
jgi:two-component system sensor histidine kinase CreC